jgi:branched-chain amino acid transport system permease protein
VIIQSIVNSCQWGSFYALIALGYTLVYGVLLFINFAHGDLFMFGAYVAYFAAVWFLPNFSSGWTFILTAVAAMLATGFLGVAIERIAYRPLRNRGANRLYIVITALMCGLILEHSNLALLGASRRRFPTIFETSVYDFGDLHITNLKLLVFAATFLVFAGLYFLVNRTRIGMAMRAISYDRFAVPLMGVPVQQIVFYTFLLGSSLAGLGGMLFVMSYPVLDPYMGATIGWKAFIAAVIGGIGDMRGALVGGFILGFIEVFIATYFSSTYRDLFAFMILLLILWMKPTGIFGVAKYNKI